MLCHKKGGKVRLLFSRLSTGTTRWLRCGVVAFVAALSPLRPPAIGQEQPLPSPEQRAHLHKLHGAALTGTRVDLKAYLDEEIAQTWPEYSGRIVLAQGDGEDATPANEFMRDFLRAYARADGVGDVATQSITLARQELAYSRKANQQGVPVTRFLQTHLGNRLAVISMPSVACRSCDKLHPARSAFEQCRVQHPDVLFHDSRNRLRNLLHELAHAVRYLSGALVVKLDSDKQREEAIAYHYADLRLMQQDGEVAVLQSQREQIRLPHQPGAGRHYISYQSRQQMLEWQKSVNPRAFARLSAPVLMQESVRFSRADLMTEQQMAALLRFEKQRSMTRLESSQRLALFSANHNVQDNETLIEPSGCSRYYPAIAREIDTQAEKFKQIYTGVQARYYQRNPYRSPALAAVSPFGFTPEDREQIAALVAFNNQRHGAVCKAVSASDITPQAMASFASGRNDGATLNSTPCLRGS